MFDILTIISSFVTGLMPSTDLQQAIAEMFSGGVYDLENEIVRAIVTTDPDQQVLCMYRIPTPLITGYQINCLSPSLYMAKSQNHTCPENIPRKTNLCCLNTIFRSDFAMH